LCAVARREQDLSAISRHVYTFDADIEGAEQLQIDPTKPTGGNALCHYTGDRKGNGT